MDPIVTVGSPNPSLQEQVPPASERPPYRNRPVKVPWNVLLPQSIPRAFDIFGPPVLNLYNLTMEDRNHEKSWKITCFIHLLRIFTFGHITIRCWIATGHWREAKRVDSLSAKVWGNSAPVGLEFAEICQKVYEIFGKKFNLEFLLMTCDDMVQSLAHTPNVSKCAKSDWREDLGFMCACFFLVDLEGGVVLILPRREHASWGPKTSVSNDLIILGSKWQKKTTRL